jgi:hypothetical protein
LDAPNADAFIYGLLLPIYLVLLQWFYVQGVLEPSVLESYWNPMAF